MFVQLQESEIADVFWVNTRLLCEPHLQIDELPLEIASLSISSTLKKIPKMLGAKYVYFPCIYLKEPKADYALWGLTFRIVSDLLEALGYPPYSELQKGRLPFRSDSWAVNIIIGVAFSKGFQTMSKPQALKIAGSFTIVLLVLISMIRRQYRSNLPDIENSSRL